MAKETKDRVRNLLVVLGGGIIFAFAIVGIMLHLYGPTGNYRLGNALLAPSLLQGLSFNDANSKTGGQSRFVFAGMEFNYYNVAQKMWRKIPVSQDLYTTFYNKFSEDKSLLHVDPEAVAAFNKGSPARLIVTVKTESDAAWQALSKVFQEVHFANEGDYFRVQLREEKSPEGTWAYFYHPGIYAEVIKIFSK